MVSAALFLWSRPGQTQTWSVAQTEGRLSLQPIPVEKLPRYGTFWSLQHSESPPLPFFAPYLRQAGIPVYLVDRERSIFMMDDTAFDYAALYKEREEQRQLREAAWRIGLLSDEEYWAEAGGSPGPMGSSYTSDDLWLEITGVTNGYAYLTLHGTADTDWYQLESKTNLAQPDGWILTNPLSEPRLGDPGTNQILFPPVSVSDTTNEFFRAHHAGGYVYVNGGSVAYEPNVVLSGGSARFAVVSTLPTQVTVFYRLGGTASNGVDYTNIPGSVAVPANQTALVYIDPIADDLVEGTESVTLTILRTNDYLIAPLAQTAESFIKDSSTLVWITPVVGASSAVEPDGPPGAGAQIASILFQRTDERVQFPPLAVRYSISGTASNGIDFVSLSGVLTFDEWETEKQLDIVPLADSSIEGVETVTVSLIPTNIYILENDSSSATETISDTTTTVSIAAGLDAWEPISPTNAAQIGNFVITREVSSGELTALTLNYQVGGMASNGADYTNLNGTVTFLPDQIVTNLFVRGIYDNQFEGDEAITITLTPIGDGYWINSNSASATIWLFDNQTTNLFKTVANLDSPAGIDYHQPSNSLIVSFNYNNDGQPSNFLRFYTNVVMTNIVTIITNWSQVHGVLDEVKLVTVKNTGFGFTNGEVYFSSGNGVGRISSEGSISNLNWCFLTNSVQTNAQPLRGSLCMDQTGIFDNSLIAVTSAGGPAPGILKGVWRVDAQGTPTLIANINTPHLEGVITLANDVAKWGPWAGTIVTGDENFDPPLIYTVAANGSVSFFNTTNLIFEGIRTEDFDIIPPNQDLYACDLWGNRIVKLSRDYFANYVGDLLITDSGEYSAPAKLFVLHWDAATTNFLTRRISYKRPDGSDGQFEHVTFAPIDLPGLTP